MKTLLEVKNRDSFRGYETGYLYVHLLALRVNTSKFSDVIVTDYTGNPDVVSEWSRVNVFGGHELPRDQLLNLQVPLEVLKSLCLDYSGCSDGRALFKGIDALHEDSNWIDISTQFCLAYIEVKLRKTVSKLTGTITRARIADVDRTSDIEAFWKRFLSLPLCDIPERTSLKPSDVVRKLQGISSETDPDKSIEAPVKIEHLDSEIDSQHNLQDILEPASQFSQGDRQRGIAPGQPAIQALQQLQLLQTLQVLPLQIELSQKNPAAVQGTQFLTQIPQSQTQVGDSNDEKLPLLFTLDSNGSVKSHYTLAELSEIPLRPDNKVYNTLAIVAGTIPKITTVISKAFSKSQGHLELTDPGASFLELVLTDVEPIEQGCKTTLSQNNILSVHIPPSEISQFLGGDFPEQLYTQLPAIEERFQKRSPKNLSFQLTLSNTTCGCVWVPQSLTLNDLF